MPGRVRPGYHPRNDRRHIEVPVRVFDGGAFVDHLTMADFEVYENGRPQEIVAAYLVKKTAVERKTEQPRDAIVPDVSRNFILIFEVREYLKKIDEALEYFLQSGSPAGRYGPDRDAPQSLQLRRAGPRPAVQAGHRE